MLRAENVWAVGRSWRLPVLAWSESGEAFVIGERGLQLAVQQQDFCASRPSSRAQIRREVAVGITEIIAACSPLAWMP